MKIKIAVLFSVLILGYVGLVCAQEKILDQYEQAGIWTVDRPNHRCLMDPGVWSKIPFDKKEQILQVIYVEEKTWWKIYNKISGKLLAEVSSWGWKVYP